MNSAHLDDTEKRCAIWKEQTCVGLIFGTKVVTQNYSKSIPKGFKWRPASILEASWEAKLDGLRFWMPGGCIQDLHGDAIWESKSVPNSLCKSFRDATNSEECFGRLWDPSDTDFETFL